MPNPNCTNCGNRYCQGGCCIVCGRDPDDADCCKELATPPGPPGKPLALTYVRDTEYGPETARIVLANRQGELTPDGHAVLQLVAHHLPRSTP